MTQFLGFGNGSDGDVSLSGTQAPVDASCSGSSGSNSLSATNPSFAADKYILVLQMRGTGVGAYEVNKIASYVAGTITTVLPLANTYTDSGASQAQVIVLPQYANVTISSSFTCKAWDGNVGGVCAFMANGRVTITSTLHVNGGNGSVVALNNSSGGKGTGGGFRGGDGNASAGEGNGFQGEGTDGAGTQTYTANGNGGGGGRATGAPTGNPGGGGGYATAGTDGYKDGGGEQGRGGGIVGIADLSTLLMGGGGGGGGRESINNVGGGGAGGGIIFIMCDYIDCSAGYIQSHGGNGGDVADRNAGGGGGAGGSILIVARTAIVGTTRITALGGTGDAGGGVGGTGRIRIQACSLTGTTNPSASSSVGGHTFCANNSAIL